MSQSSQLSTEHADKPVIPAVNYLNADRGVWSWLTTIDHKRIGIMYLVSVLIAFLLGGIFAMALRLELLTPGPTIMGANTYNRMFTLHGVVMIFLFMIPAIPGVFGNFMLPLMLGAKDVAFPQAEPAVALPLLDGRDPGARRDDHGRHRHRLDLLRALQHDDPDDAVSGLAGRVHPRLLVDPHRPQLHRHRSHAARAGHGLDAAAAVRLGHLRDQHHPGAGDAGHRPHRHAGRDREGRTLRLFRSKPGRRSGPVPAHVLVLLAPGGLHHGAARHGRGLGCHRGLRPQERVRLQDDRLLLAGDRLRRASSPGGTTCSCRGSRRSTTAPSPPSPCWSASSPPSRSSTGWPRSTRAPSRSRRRSSTSAASSSSWCSAG